MSLVDEIISQLSSSDPEEFREGILMARTVLETPRRVTTDSSSEATALSADDLDDSRVQLIVHTLQLLLLEEDSSKVGMAAFTLEYSYRVDLLEPLATLIDRFPGDGYVLLQSVVTRIPADRDGRRAAGIREDGLECAAASSARLSSFEEDRGERRE